MISSNLTNTLQTLNREELLYFASFHLPKEYLSYVDEPEDINKILRKLETDPEGE